MFISKFYILPLFLTCVMCFTSTIAHAINQNPVTLYNEFKEIKHLNSPEKFQKFESILSQINNKEFNGFRAPFYGYGAKLANQDGNFDTANNLLKKTLDALSKVKDEELLIDTLDYLSVIYFYIGDYPNAIFYVQKMADHTFKTKNSRGHAIALNRLALNYLELDLHDLAKPILDNVLKLARKNDHKRAELLSLLYLVNVHIVNPDMNPEDILLLIDKAEEVSLSLNIHDGYISRIRGIVYQKMKAYDKAIHWLTDSLRMAKRDNDVRLLRIVHRNISEYYIEIKQTKQAKKHALISLEFATKIEHHNDIASLNLILSKIYKLDGDADKALNYLQHYTDFITSDINKNIIGLLTMMNKKFDNTVQQKKIITLENSVLSAKLKAQKSDNQQYKLFMIIIIISIIFSILTVVYFIRSRILSIKVALSMKDSLTGAYGRSYLPQYLPAVTARILRAKNKNTSFGVVAIDCDDFKLINEEFGHAGGDIALKGIVGTLMEQIRTNDYLFRWGGDEFVLMCEDVSAEQLAEIAQRLTMSVDKLTINYEDRTINPTISAGYVLHEPESEFNLGQLLKQADKLLYQSKGTGKNNSIGDVLESIRVDNI